MMRIPSLAPLSLRGCGEQGKLARIAGAKACRLEAHLVKRGGR